MGKKILWTTDIHLTYAHDPREFFLAARQGDALVVSGDISEGNDLKQQLALLANNVPIPIYFVLGNHDFYKRGVDEVHGIVRRFCSRKKTNLIWLNSLRDGFVELDDGIAILGHEGWYDCQYGRTGQVFLRDFDEIKDLAAVYFPKRPFPHALVDVCRRLAQQAAVHFELVLPRVFASYDKAVLVTHVPPFAEAARYGGRQSEPAFLPFFSSKVAGDALVRIMSAFPSKRLLVLCGHSHGDGDLQVLPNLRVLTGRAQYSFPAICSEVPDV
jgi:3',5'-cyclic AMP phosphodiesterase CpdA